MDLIAHDNFHMQELEEYALQRLKSQLRSWSISELYQSIKEMYATQYKAARHVFIAEAIRSYSQVLQLAQLLQKAALVEALGSVHGQLVD